MGSSRNDRLRKRFLRRGREKANATDDLASLSPVAIPVCTTFLPLGCTGCHVRAAGPNPSISSSSQPTTFPVPRAALPTESAYLLEVLITAAARLIMPYVSPIQKALVAKLRGAPGLLPAGLGLGGAIALGAGAASAPGEAGCVPAGWGEGRGGLGGVGRRAWVALERVLGAGGCWALGAGARDALGMCAA